jgi:hypothetical protein
MSEVKKKVVGCDVYIDGFWESVACMIMVAAVSDSVMHQRVVATCAGRLGGLGYVERQRMGTELTCRDAGHDLCGLEWAAGAAVRLVGPQFQSQLVSLFLFLFSFPFSISNS